MTDDRTSPLKLRLLDEIWDEIASLEGAELDEYLAGLGLAPDDLLRDYSKAMGAAAAAPGRARFEEARRHRRTDVDSGKIVALDVARKKEILAQIKKVEGMTLAARNQRIEDEGDLNSFLEACLRLGVIDEEGNVIG